MHNQIFPNQLPKSARNLGIKETDIMIVNLVSEHIHDFTFSSNYAKYNGVNFCTGVIYMCMCIDKIIKFFHAL